MADLLQDFLQDFESILLLFEGNMLYFIPILVEKYLDCKYRRTFGAIELEFSSFLRMKFVREIVQSTIRFHPRLLYAFLMFCELNRVLRSKLWIHSEKLMYLNKDLAKKSASISREARSLMDERSVRQIVRSTIHLHPHLFSTFLLFFDLY